MKNKKQYIITFVIVFSVIIIDQWSKIYIKLNYPLSRYTLDPILDWTLLKILFVENKGMAMGISFTDLFPFLSENIAKLFLTAFRTCIILGIVYWIAISLQKKQTKIFTYSMSFILGGAIGNLLDSVFYGVLFSDSYGRVAEFLPHGGGYAPLFHGHVVDMIQIPLAHWFWPKWLPLFGGTEFNFFYYVFNVADAAVSTGALIWLFFGNKKFKY